MPEDASSDTPSGPSAVLDKIVKAYDVRGLVGEQITAELCRALGLAFGRFVSGHGAEPLPIGVQPASSVIVAHDMRDSSPELSGAFAEGVTSAGIDVVLAGLASTDMLYFASGHLGLPGAMFTASHNPASYNGVKVCLAGAVPLSLGTGLAAIRDEAKAILDGNGPAVSAAQGNSSEQDLRSEYADFLLSLVDLTRLRPLSVVVDAGNGMAGYTVPAVLGGLPLQLHELYFELDGSFPNHEANPLDPKNLVDLQDEVRRVGADIGLAFDGDADRCFVIDEKGDAVSPSAVTGLVAARELARHPGATILHNLITSRAVPEVITEHGGVPVRTRVGHSFIKAEMARTGAVFGGEHSAHYYFADFYRADTGMLAAMHVLAALGGQDLPLSRLAAEYERYSASGEINSTVHDVPAVLTRVRAWAAEQHAEIDELDGLTMTRPDGSWANVRSSNTEPLLRLNAEATTEAEMATLRDELLGIIRG
ncbi:MAG: phosphomannomutase/phosphoglucomutase [Actinomycetota bacterium]|nr:phosphomannomutase/phosphoglucomutase [Actinomycetota bacterium]